MFDGFASCITDAAWFLLCHFSENLGSLVIAFVLTDVCKIQDVLLSALEGLFVDVRNGSPQFGDSVVSVGKSGACCDRERKLLIKVNNMSNGKALLEPRLQLAPHRVVEFQLV